MDLISNTQCTATNRTGERCGRRPFWWLGLRDARRQHRPRSSRGTTPPTGRSGPRHRIPVNMLEPRPPCPHCGRSDADRDPVVVRAAQIVLDRAGIGPTANIVIENPSEPVTRIERVIVGALPSHDAEVEVIEVSTEAEPEATSRLQAGYSEPVKD